MEKTEYSFHLTAIKYQTTTFPFPPTVDGGYLYTIIFVIDKLPVSVVKYTDWNVISSANLIDTVSVKCLGAGCK